MLKVVNYFHWHNKIGRNVSWLYSVTVQYTLFREWATSTVQREQRTNTCTRAHPLPVASISMSNGKAAWIWCFCNTSLLLSLTLMVFRVEEYFVCMFMSKEPENVADAYCDNACKPTQVSCRNKNTGILGYGYITYANEMYAQKLIKI